MRYGEVQAGVGREEDPGPQDKMVHGMRCEAERCPVLLTLWAVPPSGVDADWLPPPCFAWAWFVTALLAGEADGAEVPPFAGCVGFASAMVAGAVR